MISGGGSRLYPVVHLYVYSVLITKHYLGKTLRRTDTGSTLLEIRDFCWSSFIFCPIFILQTSEFDS